MTDTPLFNQPSDPTQREPLDSSARPPEPDKMLIYSLGGWLIFLVVLSTWLLMSQWPVSSTPAEKFKQLSDTLISQIDRIQDSCNVKDKLASLKSTIQKTQTDSSLVHIKETLGDDRRYFWVVIAAGILGACAHALSSLFDFLGMRRFVESWKWWYMGLPVVGGIVALIFYMILRANLLSSAPDSNRYLITSLAFLTGMFTDKATTKLGEILGVLFTPKQDRSDKLTDNNKPEPKKATEAQDTDIPAVG